MPNTPRNSTGYQLIRNVLAAVHAPAFTPRLKLLTWQELAATLPRDLQSFLAAKYGVTP